MFHHQAVIGVQSFKRNHQVIGCIFQQCIALIFWAHVLQVLWSIIYCSSHHCLRSITIQDWCLWVLRSAGERDRHPGCALWTLTNLEPNTQCTRLPMQSTGNCTLVVWRGALPIKIWTTDRQTDRMKGQIFVSKQAWMTATSVIKWTALCVLCTVEIYIKSADRQDKALVSGSKGDLIDSAQWGYQMKCTICVQAHLRAKTMLNFLLSVNAS